MTELCRTMIDDALTITIVLSMAVLVIYPTSLMIVETLQMRRRRRVPLDNPRRRN